MSGHDASTPFFANSDGDGLANVDVVKWTKTQMVMAQWTAMTNDTWIKTRSNMVCLWLWYHQ